MVARVSVATDRATDADAALAIAVIAALASRGAIRAYVAGRRCAADANDALAIRVTAAQRADIGAGAKSRAVAARGAATTVEAIGAAGAEACLGAVRAFSASE